MEQDLWVKDQGQARAKVWVVVRVGAKWAGRRQQGRAELVYAPAAGQQSLILSGSPAIKEAVQNVVQK